MADPLYVLKEITKGIFEIWSEIGNIKKIQDFWPIFKLIYAKMGQKSDIFLNISRSRPNFQNPSVISINK